MNDDLIIRLVQYATRRLDKQGFVLCEGEEPRRGNWCEEATRVGIDGFTGLACTRPRLCRTR